MDKDNGMLWSCMCSLIEILWVLKEKISLNCWQLQHDVPVTEFLNLTHLWTFFIFYQTEWTCWVFLLPVRSQEHLKEIQAFEAAIWYLGDQ